jgi:hypothetical protein
MKIRLFLSMAVVCLFLSGCDDSKNPLSDPQKSKPDSRLAGVWRVRDTEGDVTYYHIGAVGDKLPRSLMRAIGVTHKKNGRIEPAGEFLIFPTPLGRNTYLNLAGGDQQHIKLLEEKGWNPEAAGGFFLLKYAVEGDALTVWPMDADAKRRAIEIGKIKGLIEKQQYVDTIRFTDTTENVARFVAGAGDGLFSKDAKKVLRLERVK